MLLSRRIGGTGFAFSSSGAVDHGLLTGLADDDHPQYHNDARGDTRYYREDEHINASTGPADAGKPVVLDANGHIDSSMINNSDIDHGSISGLTDDDHLQYLILTGVRPMTGTLLMGANLIDNIGGLDLAPRVSNPDGANTVWANSGVGNFLHHGTFRMAEHAGTLVSPMLVYADANLRLANSGISYQDAAAVVTKSLFYGYHGADSSVSHGTWTQVELDQVFFDTDGIIDSSSTFKVNGLGRGYYNINWAVTIATNTENPLMANQMGMLTSRIVVVDGETTYYVRGSNYNWDADETYSWDSDPAELPRTVGGAAVYFANGEGTIELQVFYEDISGGGHSVKVLNGQSYSFLSGCFLRGA